MRALLLLPLLLSTAAAHGMDPGLLIVRLAGDTLTLKGTPQATIFKAFDANQDGLIDRAELKANRAAMLAHLATVWRITDHTGAVGEVTLSDLSLPHTHGKEPGRGHLHAMLRYTFKRPPEWLVFESKSPLPLRITAQRFTAAPKLPNQRPLGPPVVVQLKPAGRADLLREAR